MLFHMRGTRGVHGNLLCSEGGCNTGVSRDQHGIHKETVKGGSRSVFDKYELKGAQFGARGTVVDPCASASEAWRSGRGTSRARGLDN